MANFLKISKEEFLLGASKAKLNPDQAENFWKILEILLEEKPKPKFWIQILFYVIFFLGILMAGWFTLTSLLLFNAEDLYIIALVYLFCFIIIGNLLFGK